MSEAIHPDGKFDEPWPAGDPRTMGPDSSVSPSSGKESQAALDLLNHAIKAAHKAIDGLADRATPVAQQLGDRVSAAEDMLHRQTQQLHDTGDKWVASARASVRGNPLVFVVGALALGALIARITR